jgi:hypothetical protein
VLLNEVACVNWYLGTLFDPFLISLEPEPLLDFAPGDSDELKIMPLNRDIRDRTTNPLAHLCMSIAASSLITLFISLYRV